MAPPKESTAPTVLLQRPPKLVSGRGSSGRAERGWQGDRGAGSNRPGRQFGASGLYQARPANQDVPRQVRSTATEDSSSGLKKHLKLVDSNWCFQGSPQRFSTILTKATDFLVVGVLGGQGVGKSSILNRLCGFTHSRTDAAIPFEVSSGRAAMAGLHTTSGVDIRVCSERILAIDTQPIQSSSILSALGRMNSPPSGLMAALETMQKVNGVVNGKALGTVSAEALAELMDLQLAVWLLQVCHVVVVIGKDQQEMDTWQLLSLSGMIFSELPLGASGEASGDKQSTQAGATGAGVADQQPPASGAQVLAGAANVDLSPHNWAAIAAFRQRVSSALQRLPGFVPAGLFLLPAASASDVDIASSRARAPAARAATADIQQASRKAAGGGAERWYDESHCWQAACDELCKHVLRTAQRQACKSPARSELDWLAAAERSWKSVQRSPLLAEYIVRLQDTRYHGAGGWRLT